MREPLNHSNTRALIEGVVNFQPAELTGPDEVTTTIALPDYAQPTDHVVLTPCNADVLPRLTTFTGLVIDIGTGKILLAKAVYAGDGLSFPANSLRYLLIPSSTNT